MFVYLAQHPIVSPLFFADHDVFKLIGEKNIAAGRKEPVERTPIPFVLV